MSVSGKSPSGASNSSATGLAREVFCRHVHLLLAEGYSRLIPNQLRKAAEEDITGELVRTINEYFDDPSSPDWVSRYMTSEEERVNDGKRLGKARRRLDITFVCAAQRPRPRFRFECKRLGKSGDVAKYLSGDGMGAFLDGTYAADDHQVGMIGYVQSNTTESWAVRIQRRLSNGSFNRTLIGATTWRNFQFESRIGMTRVSRHRRKSRLPIVDVYHTFLAFT